MEMTGKAGPAPDGFKINVNGDEQECPPHTDTSGAEARFLSSDP
jgi:hypothetical protein